MTSVHLTSAVPSGEVLGGLTKEQLAARLYGRVYGNELSKAEALEAKAAGLLVIYGASDDLLEFDGAFREEVGAWGGTTARIHAGGVVPSWEALEKDTEEDVLAYFADKAKSREVTASWDVDGYSWVITTDIPHATFSITDEGEPFCKGVVIAIADLVSESKS